MKWAFRGALAVIVVAVVVWAWLTFFPGPEQAIRKRLSEVAQLASFAGKEGELAIPLNAQKLTSCFTPDAEISVDVPELRQKFSGQDQLFKAAMAVRSTLSSLKVEMLDINITFAPDKTSAVANVTLKVRANGDRDFVPQEVKFTLKKIKGEWLIQEAETVRTLSLDLGRLPEPDGFICGTQVCVTREVGHRSRDLRPEASSTLLVSPLTL